MVAATAPCTAGSVDGGSASLRSAVSVMPAASTSPAIRPAPATAHPGPGRSRSTRQRGSPRDPLPHRGGRDQHGQDGDHRDRHEPDMHQAEHQPGDPHRGRGEPRCRSEPLNPGEPWVDECHDRQPGDGPEQQDDGEGAEKLVERHRADSLFHASRGARLSAEMSRFGYPRHPDVARRVASRGGAGASAPDRHRLSTRPIAQVAPDRRTFSPSCPRQRWHPMTPPSTPLRPQSWLEREIGRGEPQGSAPRRPAGSGRGIHSAPASAASRWQPSASG